MQFCIVELCRLILEYIPNKCGYVIHHFNAHFWLYAFPKVLLFAVYFIFILDYRNDVRQKANSSDFLVQRKKVKLKSLSRIRLFATPQTVAYQAPPSMGFSRQEYWSGLPFPSPKSTETTCNVNNMFGPGTANKRTVQWWFKNFSKEPRALKMSIVASHWKLITTNGEQSSKLILLYNHVRGC